MKFVLWLSLFLVVVVPGPSVFNISSNLKLGDIVLFFVAIIPCVNMLFSKSLRANVILGNVFVPAFAFYVFLILVLPLIGVAIFPYGMEVYWGDLRWLEFIVVFIAFLYYYRGGDVDRFKHHLTYFLFSLVALQLPFIVLQYMYEKLGYEPGFLLGSWYPDGESELGVYGIHASRYAGAMSSASSLAILGAVAATVAGLHLYIERSSKLFFWVFFVSSCLLMLASGSRTILFSFPLILLFGVAYEALVRGRLTKRVLVVSFFIILLAPVLYYLVVHFNLGRLATQERLGSVVTMVSSSDTSFEEVSGGRGGDRWVDPIKIAYQQYTLFGTLANPAHVLSDMGVFDSYLVFTLAQGGPVLLLSFLTVVLLLVAKGLKLIFVGNGFGFYPYAVGSVLLVYSITSNLMTDLFPRLLMVSALFMLVTGFESKRDLGES